jgi:hypothetical protein
MPREAHGDRPVATRHSGPRTMHAPTLDVACINRNCNRGHKPKTRATGRSAAHEVGRQSSAKGHYAITKPCQLCRSCTHSMRLRCVRPHNSERAKCASPRFEKNIYPARLAFPDLGLIYSGRNGRTEDIFSIPSDTCTENARRRCSLPQMRSQSRQSTGPTQQDRHHEVSRLLSTIRYTTTALPEGGHDG